MDRDGWVLVVGADGLIGRTLCGYLESVGKRVLRTTRRREQLSSKRVFLDLEDEAVAEWDPRCRITIAYLCGGVTSLGRCRREPERSHRVNVDNTARLARRLAGDGAFVVFLSTNLVYDGSVPLRRADEATCPVTEYGRQKAAVERALLASGAGVSIVRLTKVVSGEIMPFRGWLQALRNREPIYPFADMMMAPLPLAFAIEALHRIADRRLEGIVQVSAERDISFADAARRLASRMSAPLDLVRPVSAAEAGRSFEAIPKHTTLDTCRLRVEAEMTPPEAWCAIDEVA